jgi:hypothetical protein
MSDIRSACRLSDRRMARLAIATKVEKPKKVRPQRRLRRGA